LRAVIAPGIADPRAIPAEQASERQKQQQYDEIDAAGLRNRTVVVRGGRRILLRHALTDNCLKSGWVELSEPIAARLEQRRWVSPALHPSSATPSPPFGMKSIVLVHECGLRRQF